MRFGCALFLLAACWHGSTTPPPSPPPAVATGLVEPKEPCTPFSVDDPTCKDVCPDFDPPENWPRCMELVARLTAKGYTCTGTTPRSCRAPAPTAVHCPPTGCQPVVGRVIGLSISGSHVDITIGVGSNQGVTPAWKATLVDGPNGMPVANGAITIVRIDANVTRGTIGLTPATIKNTPYVRLEP